MEIKLDTYDFNIVLACFWCNEDGQWVGTIKKSLDSITDAKIIASDRIALIIRKPGEPN
jgi:hypothetical protein